MGKINNPRSVNAYVCGNGNLLPLNHNPQVRMNMIL
jgi:hypothetical protein